MTMCIDSGLCEMKSNCRLASWRKVTGSGFWEWMKSGNLIASRIKNTPRLLPTRSQFAVLGVELDREAARVARRLRGVPPAGDRGQAQGHVGALALLLEELGPRVYLEIGSSPQVP